MDKEKENKVVQMPQREQMPVENSQPSELEIRAQNEMAMLQRTAQKKQMQAHLLFFFDRIPLKSSKKSIT